MLDTIKGIIGYCRVSTNMKIQEVFLTDEANLISVLSRRCCFGLRKC